MKGEDIVPTRAWRTFMTALKTSSTDGGGLPSPLPMGVVLRIFDYDVVPEEVTRRGELNTDEDLAVLAGKDESGYFLDYYRVDNDNDGQTSRHGRIREDGKVEGLENFEGQWGRQKFPDDPDETKAELERMLTNNARVKKILRAKGFS